MCAFSIIPVVVILLLTGEIWALPWPVNHTWRGSASFSWVNTNWIRAGIFFSAVGSIQPAQTTDPSLLIKLTRAACMCISSKGTSLSLTHPWVCVWSMLKVNVRQKRKFYHLHTLKKIEHTWERKFKILPFVTEDHKRVGIKFLIPVNYRLKEPKNMPFGDRLMVC